MQNCSDKVNSNEKKILVLGSTGQVGKVLKENLPKKMNLFCPSRKILNLNDLESISYNIKLINPHLIINLAAYTAVDDAENNHKEAFLINSEVVSIISQEAQNLNIPFIHFSTDYVFDGRTNFNYSEIDTPNPLNVYGESKLAGELNASKYCEKHLIFRTSSVYGLHGKNFYNTMIQLFNTKEELKVVHDQIHSPTSSYYISKKIIKIVKTIFSEKKISWGLYHLTCSGEASWYEFAKKIFEIHKEKNYFNIKIKTISPILSSQYKSLAKRPKRTILDNTKTKINFQLYQKNWANELNRILKTNN
jgi:dTDP-4-dehydrorhamnose reductase